MSDAQRPRTTTDSGIPATSDEFSATVGPAGPIPLHDHYVVQKMQHFNRERVPERVVQAKGGGDLFWSVPAGELGWYAYEKHAEDDDFGQAGTLVRAVMTDTDREHLVTNIIGHAGSEEVSADMQQRVIAYWTNIDADLGARVAAGGGGVAGRRPR